MGPVVRALGWAGRILLIIIALYVATSLYSFVNLLMGGAFGMGQPGFAVKGEDMSVSIPFSFNNTGYYDVTDLNLSTVINDLKGNLLSKDETIVASIPRGVKVERTHNVSLSLMKLFSGNITRLLLEDNEFRANVSIGWRYAQSLGFRIDLGGMPFQWGAPMSNLSLKPGALKSNGTHNILETELSFENHSQFFALSG